MPLRIAGAARHGFQNEFLLNVVLNPEHQLLHKGGVHIHLSS
jgi:hypothetical protein